MSGSSELDICCDPSNRDRHSHRARWRNQKSIFSYLEKTVANTHSPPKPLIILAINLLLTLHLTCAMWIIDYQAYNALVGTSVSLPCNITPPTSDDGVSLILWYRDDQSSPIYTVDARIVMNVASGKHHLDTSALANRASFNLTFPVSYLHFAKVIERDTAEYRCRVDFRRGRTINRVMQLNVIVPSQSISIHDSSGNFVNDIAGPFNEDAPLNLTCDSEGGYPAANLKWFRGDVLETNRSTTIDISRRVVRSIVSFERLAREHLMMPLTCESSNSNLTVPLTKTILVDLNLKPTEVQIIRPATAMRVGERVELVCQSSGSRPPARIVWRKGGRTIGAHSESSSDDGAVTTNFLTFVPTIEDNGRALTCRATNPQFVDFNLDDTLRLDVHYPPILSLLLGASDQRGEISEGSDVYFDCDIQANPAITKFEWTFNGRPLLDEFSSLSLSVTSSTTAETATAAETAARNSESKVMSSLLANMKIRNNSIVINNVSRHHIGAYRCSAVNSLGDSVSDIVNLSVKYTPYCLAGKRTDFELPLFGQIDIECRVESDPAEVTFYWEFNSTHSQDMVDDDQDLDGVADILENIQQNGESQQTVQQGMKHHRVRQQHQPLMSIQNTGRTSRLRFTPRSESDFGTLFCFATNRIGRQREPCVFHVRRSKTPHPPRNCTVIEFPSLKSTADNNKSANNTVTVQCDVAITEPGSTFHLEAFNESDNVVTNITSLNAHFKINHEQLRRARTLVVFARNQNGESVRVDITANITVAGEPRKLEHIEAKMNGRPTLFLGIALTVALLLFVLIVLVLLLHKRRSMRQIKTPVNKSKKSCPSEMATPTTSTTTTTTTFEQTSRMSASLSNSHANLHDDLLVGLDGVPNGFAHIVNDRQHNGDGDFGILSEEKTDFESKFPLAAFSLSDGTSHHLLQSYPTCNGFEHTALVGGGSTTTTTTPSYLELTNLDSLPDMSSLSHTLCTSEHSHLTGEPILFLQADCSANGQVYSDCVGLAATAVSRTQASVLSSDLHSSTHTISTIPCILVAQPHHSSPSLCIISTPTKSATLSSNSGPLSTTDEADSSSSMNSSTLTRSAPKVRFID